MQKLRRATLCNSNNKSKPLGVKYWAEEKRTQKDFATLLESDIFRNECNRELDLPAEISLTPIERLKFIELKRLLIINGSTLNDIIKLLPEFLEEKLNKNSHQNLKIDEVIDEYICNCESQGMPQRHNQVL